MATLLASEWKWYPFLFDGEGVDLFRTIFFWITIALALVAIVTLLVFRENKKLRLFWLVAGIVYACAVGGIFLYFSFTEDGILNILFYPLLAVLAIVAICAVVLAFCRKKPVIIACAVLFALSLLSALVCMGIFFASGEATDGITVDENVGLIVSVVLLVAVIGALAFFFGKDGKKDFDTKSIAYAAVCIAMSFALSYLRIVKMPQGGSITVASLLPLMIYSYLFGVRKGVFAGFIYGVLQAIQDPYLVHPAQFLLDYPIAFSAIGLSGMFSSSQKLQALPQVQFLLGGIVASALRYLSHVLSGAFAFSEYAGDQNVWIYTLGYNSFVFLDVAIVLVVGVLIFSAPATVKEFRRIKAENTRAR